MLLFNGIPIESCEVLKQPENTEATVFITAVLYATQIAAMLEKMGFKGRVIDMTKRGYIGITKNAIFYYHNPVHCISLIKILPAELIL